jgi:acyl-CoA thioesterase-2
MPHTSLSSASDLVSPYAIRPAGPVIRIFSPANTLESYHRLVYLFRVRSAPPDETRPPPSGSDPRLERAILAALDRLLHALELEPLGGGRFRAPSESGRFADRVFGGQVIAQALVAAGRTVSGKVPASLYAYFVEAGDPSQPIHLTVDSVRDGRSIATRRVTVAQGERNLLISMCSFHAGPTSPEIADPAPSAPSPEALPVLQAWVQGLPPEVRERNLNWVEQPPPLELRIGEPPHFMGGPAASGPRSHWMRLPRDVGGDALLHTALLAYASDYLLMDMVLRSHPERIADGPFVGFSLDHALWFHRPVRLERWHLYTQQTQALSGHRGLVRGFIHDADGHLVASVMQDELVRRAR